MSTTLPTPLTVIDKEQKRVDPEALKRIHAAASEPEPLRRSLSPSKDYPVDALGTVLAAAARSLHANVKSPLALCGQSVLAAASLAVQPHADVYIHGRQHPLTLWHITVAESGERKSATDTIALSAHRKHEHLAIHAYQRAFPTYQAQLAAYEAALKQVKNRKNATVAEIAAAIAALGPVPSPPPRGILICAEPTVEALQKLYLANVPSLGLFSDEGAGFFGGYSMNSEHAQRSTSTLSKLWDDGSSDRIRATDGANKLYGRRLALHMLMQPVIAERVLSNELLVGQGFLARCLIAWPETTAGTRMYEAVDVRNEPAIRIFGAHVATLLERAPRFSPDHEGELDPRALTLTPDALETWTTAHNAIEERMRPGGPYSHIKGWASKGPEQILRVAGVLTIFGNVDARYIEAGAVADAARLVAWHLGEAMRLVDTASVPLKVQRAEAVLKWCREHGAALVDAKTLQNRGPSKVRQADDVTEAMAVLVEHGWATPVENPVINGKRVRRAWTVRLESQESQESQKARSRE